MIILAENYEQAMQQLREYVYENESERREWAREKWGHVGGKLFKAARVLIPVFSAISIIFAVFYAMIRDAQTFLSRTGGLSYQAEESSFDLYIVIAYCVLIVAANAVSIARLRLIGEFSCAAAALLMSVYLLTQINIAMPNDQFKTMLLIVIGLNLLLIAVCMAAAIIELTDRHSLKKSFDRTLVKIIGKNDGLTEEKDYQMLIEQFLSEKNSHN